MKRPQIEKGAYEAWAKSKVIEYAAARVITYPDGYIRLVFAVTLSGEYRVILGRTTLYAGDSFDAAKQAFDDAA